MVDEPFIDDPYPATPMMADSLIEEFGVQGVLVLLYRELEGSTRKTDVFARLHISALVGELADIADREGEAITPEQRQRWLDKHGFEDSI